MSTKQIKRLIEYVLYGIKGLIVLVGSILQAPVISVLAYFLAELTHNFASKYFSDQEKDLSDEKQEEVLTSQRGLKSDFDKLRKEQEEYNQKSKELEAKTGALKLLNRLINEGLIRGKDLLSLAGSADYYQLFIYSVPATQLLRGEEEKERIGRRYPLFLQKLGFVRLGKNSSFYLINKNTLKNKKLKEAKEFKKFLDYHLSKIKAEEWSDCLEMMKEKYPKLYEKFKDKTYKEARVLQINYLLTESNINATNIGYVDGDNIGLARVEENEKVIQQILKGFNFSTKKVDEDVRVRIKKVMEKLDILFLVEGIKKADKQVLILSQDSLKEFFVINSVVEFYKVNKEDLITQLKKGGFSKKKAGQIAELVITSATTYHQALEELGVNLS